MLEIKLEMKRFFLCLGLFVFMLLNGCAALLPPLMVSEPGGFNEEDWKVYGAVYEYDELRIFTEDLNPDQGWSSYYYINQKLHILNRRGVECGTIYLPKYGDTLVELVVTLWDQAGNEVKLDLDAIRKKYSRTEKIIVPKVEPGCQIALRVVFRKANLIYSFDHWFEKNIPVLKARFSIYHPKNVKYDCKSYGTVKPVQQQSSGHYIGYVWDHKNILPRDDVFENRWRIDRGPHIMARVKQWSWEQHYRYDAPDWKALARQFKKFFLSPSIFTSKSSIKKIVAGVVNDQKGAFKKADAILAYVQDEITLDTEINLSLDSINLNKVLDEKSGDCFEIAVLLKEMFEAAGISTRTYLTRPQDIGGFDPDFPTWRSLDIPLVAIEIDGRELVAFPYIQFMALGEYPFKYHDLQALDLEKGTIATLPKSIHADANRKSLATLSPENWDRACSWKLIYGGFYAPFLREEMSTRTPDERKGFFRSVIRGYDKENNLEDVDLTAINRTGDIAVALKYRNTSFKTDRAGTSHYSLKPWFRKYFTDYDKSRKVNYTNDFPLVFEDSVLIEKDQNALQTCYFECANLDNLLFCAHCNQKDTQTGVLLSRKLTIKQADLNPEQMQNIYADIMTLNRIDESYIIREH